MHGDSHRTFSYSAARREWATRIRRIFPRRFARSCGAQPAGSKLLPAGLKKCRPRRVLLISANSC
jgi:hypothetical protein